MNPNGTPQNTGYTVNHTAGTGCYTLVWNAGTFTKPAWTVVMPISPNPVAVNFMTVNTLLTHFCFADGQEYLFTFISAQGN